MKWLIFFILVMSLLSSSAFAQDLNKIVFGPLEGDEAGILTVHNGETIEVEVWVRTDPELPSQIVGVEHALLSEDLVISERQGFEVDPDYDPPDWEMVWVDGPYVHNPEDAYPIPEGWTCEVQVALCAWNPPGDCLHTEGEWDHYGTWTMVVNTGLPIGQTYFPFTEGWYPHSGHGTIWVIGPPPGDAITPEADYCGLYVESNVCSYVPGDCDHDGNALELDDVIAMVSLYRGTIEPYYLCECGQDPVIYNFAATADPNGNCVPFELGDVVTEIGGYRGTTEASGCPDCPGLP